MRINGKPAFLKAYYCFKQLFWLLALLSSSLFAGAQSNEAADSRLSNRVYLKDTAAVMQQLRLAGTIAERYNDSAFKLTVQALESSRRFDFTKGVAASFFQLSTLFFLKGEFDKSISSLHATYRSCDTSAYSRTLMVRVLSNIAQCYSIQGKMDSTAFYSYRALNAIETLKVDNPDVLVRVYSAMIILWVNLYGDFDGNIDNQYFQSANAYFNKVVSQEFGGKKTRGLILISMGHLQNIRNNNDSARFFYRQYLELVKKGGMGRQNGTINSTLINICETFIDENNADSAYSYAAEAISRIKEKGTEQILPLIPIVSDYYLARALCMQKKYHEAIVIANKAIVASEKAGLSYRRDMAYLTLSKCYSALNNYFMAWSAQNKYEAAKDSITKHEKILSISQMEMKYRVAEKNKELVEKELTISRRDNSIRTRNFWIAGIGMILLFGGIIAFLVYRYSLQHQKIRTLKASIEGEEKERSRLARELHDGIGSSLGSIRLQLSSVINDGHTDSDAELKKILHLLAETYTELRKTSHNLLPQTLQQEGLEKATALFCQDISNGNIIPVDFEIVGLLPELKPDVELTVYRIIQELVHNIIKHAKATRAMVQLAFIGNKLGVTVEDNGIGMPDADDVSNSGIGIKMIRERVKTLGGTIEISSSPFTGTSINLLFRID